MDTVTLTRAEYQELIDARDHAVAMRAVASGAMATLSDGDHTFRPAVRGGRLSQVGAHDSARLAS